MLLNTYRAKRRVAHGLVGAALLALAAVALSVLLLPPGGASAQSGSEQTSRQLCEQGDAVPEPEKNSALVADCATLLDIADTLTGRADVNWSADLAMAEWDGIEFDGVPPRVTKISLMGRKMTGSIPAELGDLTGLTLLHLHNNRLRGGIPSAVGQTHAAGVPVPCQEPIERQHPARVGKAVTTAGVAAEQQQTDRRHSGRFG